MSALSPTTRARLRRLARFTLFAGAVLVGLVIVEVSSLLTVGSLFLRLKSIPAAFSSECGDAFAQLAGTLMRAEHGGESKAPWRILEHHALVLESSDANTCHFWMTPLHGAFDLRLYEGPFHFAVDKRTGVVLAPHHDANDW